MYFYVKGWLAKKLYIKYFWAWWQASHFITNLCTEMFLIILILLPKGKINSDFFKKKYMKEEERKNTHIKSFFLWPTIVPFVVKFRQTFFCFLCVIENYSSFNSTFPKKMSFYIKWDNDQKNQRQVLSGEPDLSSV